MLDFMLHLSQQLYHGSHVGMLPPVLGLLTNNGECHDIRNVF